MERSIYDEYQLAFGVRCNHRGRIANQRRSR